MAQPKNSERGKDGKFISTGKALNRKSFKPSAVYCHTCKAYKPASHKH